jgi:hypothetical protein
MKSMGLELWIYLEWSLLSYVGVLNLRILITSFYFINLKTTRDYKVGVKTVRMHHGR